MTDSPPSPDEPLPSGESAAEPAAESSPPSEAASSPPRSRAPRTPRARPAAKTTAARAKAATPRTAKTSGTTPRTPRAPRAPRARPQAAPATPGPPPPLPRDLVPAPDLVIPPRPPLPVAAALPAEAEHDGAAQKDVEQDDVQQTDVVSPPGDAAAEDVLLADPGTVSADEPEPVIQSEPAADVLVPEPELAVEPEPEEEAEVEVQAAIAVEPEEELAVEPQPEPEEELAVEPEFEAMAEPMPHAETESVTEAESAVDSEPAATVVEVEPEAEVEPADEPGPASADEPVPAVEGDADAEPELAGAPQTEPGVEDAAGHPEASVVGTEPESPLEETETDGESEPEVDLQTLLVDADASVVDDAIASDLAGKAVPALALRAVSKSFGGTRAVDAIDLTVPAGSFYGLVGPNGAGKTTTLSMIAGLLRPDSGTVSIAGVDGGRDPAAAKRLMGVLPDRLRTFDRLTGRQLLYYYGVLRGLPSAVVEIRIGDLARAFDLVEALGRAVSDYSAGMTKKVMLAGAMIHSPRLLVLDEPFESVDPVSSAVILDILTAYVAHGGTVILSSHGMELVERVCSRVAVLVAGQVLAEGTIQEVRGELTLEERFIELAGGLGDLEGLEWLHTFSD